MLCSAWRVVGIGLRQHVNGVGFDEGQPAVNIRQEDGQVDGAVGGLVTVRRAVMAIHAVHLAQGGFIDGVGEPGRAEFGHDALRQSVTRT